MSGRRACSRCRCHNAGRREGIASSGDLLGVGASERCFERRLALADFVLVESATLNRALRGMKAPLGWAHFRKRSGWWAGAALL